MMDAVGSLCSGYGGLDIALSSFLDMPIAWHAEIEKLTHPKTGIVTDNPVIEVLEARYPGIPNHGDITAIDWASLARTRALASGFPCQGVSSAGRQLGDLDPRWLWPAVRAGIEVMRPEWIGIENVANLASIQNGRLWRGVLADLEELGYDVAWGIFGACRTEVGGCHHRHRLFALARLVREPGPAVRWAGKACGVPPRRAPLLATPTVRDGEGRGEGSAQYWEARQAERSNGAPLGAQLRLLPTPRTADSSGGRIDLRERINGTTLPTELSLLPTPRASDGVHGGPGQRGSSGDLAMPSAVQPQNYGRFEWAVNRWTARYCQPPQPTEVGPNGGLRMNPRFPEWMMGLAPGYVTDILARNDAIAAIGNGVFPLQAAGAFALLGTLLRASEN